MMKKHLSKILFAHLLFVSLCSIAQEKDANTKVNTNQTSNIQTYTPSKLLSKGQWDVKFFNNLYTETKGVFNGVKSSKEREIYFTTSLEVFTGITDNNRVNIGLLLEYRSNTINGKGATSVFNFSNRKDARNGLSSFAPAIKWQPIENVGNFSIQSAFHIPLIDQETKNGLKDENGTTIRDAVFLDQKGYTFQNRFFYDYTFPSRDWQLFTELNTEYHFGDTSLTDNNGNTIKGSFANNTVVLAPGVFMSYFPSDTTTVLGFVQHFQRIGDFTQNFTALGFGGKYQLNQTLNLEVLYSKFVRGDETGLGQSFNIGLRALF